MVSGAMGLPISSFPNANSMATAAAVASAGSDGVQVSRPILQTSDYVRTGFPMCLAVLLLVNTGGHWLAALYGW